MLSTRVIAKTMIGSAALYVFCISGCSLNPTTVKTDEVTPQSTGQIAIASFSEQDSLMSTLSIAGTGLSALSLNRNFGISAATGLGKAGLGKIRSTDSTVTIDFGDTARGIVRLMYAKQNLIFSSFDTLVVKWDSIAKDTTIHDKNIVSASGAKILVGAVTQRYAVSDLDGDGIVSGQPQYNGTARFTYSAAAGNTVENLVMDVSAGPDDNFNTDADNRIIALSWNRTVKGAVMATATFTDADSDDVLIDKSKSAPSAVDVVVWERSPIAKPFVDSTTLSFRILTNGKDSASDQIIRLGGVEQRKSGMTMTISAINSHGRQDIMPYDTAIVTIAGTAATQIGWKDSTTLVFDVQSGLKNAVDHALYELHMRKEHQDGLIVSKTFDFTTTQPVKSGQKPQSGHVTVSVTHSSGKTASLVADFNQNGFSGTWTGPDGKTVSVTWDAQGNVVK